MKYTGNALNEISFPLGGIGTGCVGLSGNGRLIDWEIFNQPNKGSLNGYTHIAVKAKQGDAQICKVLQGDLTKDLTGAIQGVMTPNTHRGFGYGPAGENMCGFPHFRTCEFTGEFPIASIAFSDADFPGTVTLTAFNPFIPLNSADSSIPAAFFEITFTNPTDAPIVYQAAFSLRNPFACSRNEAIETDGMTAIWLKNAGHTPEEYEYGELCIACENASEVQPYWYRGDWQDRIVMFWNQFTSKEGLTRREYDQNGKFDTCSLASDVTLAPGESKAVRFVMSWNIPNNANNWKSSDVTKLWKNYYATVFENAIASATYCIENWQRLYGATKRYKDELFASTLDPAVIDAAASTVSVLKSRTVYRLENGEFYGFEGTTEHWGSCEGTCQHVYNYAYALCFLFPDLERSIRQLEFERCMKESGETAFRVHLPLEEPQTFWIPCVDGQMGCVIKTYREWKISGDNEWLKKMWPSVKKALEFAWSDQNDHAWDLDKDGVLEGRQHHTLDMELFGPSSWLEGFYLAALRAASEMARFLGEGEKADEYDEIFEKGYAWTRDNLFNGQYFIQKIDLTDKDLVARFNCVERFWNEETGEIKYQIGEGSEIDQMCGQWHANICGLGRIFDDAQVHTALESMVKHNFKASMRGFANPWRIFALNDDAGSVICDYPQGAYKPKIPITYCEESMHGFEYQFAGLLISEGYIEDGLRAVRAVRDRYQGYNRNPWNEIECGSNYARSMASFALLPIFSGMRFDLPRGMIGFDPKVNKDAFRCLWSLGTGWGNVQVKKGATRIEIISGELTLSRVELPYISAPEKLVIDGVESAFTVENGVIVFEKTTAAHAIEVFYER